MRWLIALLLFGIPSGAFALSCLPPNAARSLDHAMQSGASVHAVAGTLQPLRADTVSPAGQTDKDIIYRLQGTQLSRGGWLTDIDVELRIETRCISNWCGKLPVGSTDGLFFLTSDQTGALILRIGPCGGTIFPPPDAEQRDALQRCAKAGRCKAEDLRLFELR